MNIETNIGNIDAIGNPDSELKPELDSRPGSDRHSIRGSELIKTSLITNPWITKRYEDLDLLQSPLLITEQANGLEHAFTTRHGGQTPPPYESFNLGRHVANGDLKADALANRELLCRVLGFNHDHLKVPGQVHSGNVVHIAQAEANPDLSGVDALATSLGSVPLLLHFADCVPVIIYERKRKLLAIAHAGWRGTAQAIVKNAVQLLVNNFGGDPSQMIAAVGPAIGTCCYPTDQDVIQKLLDTVAGQGFADLDRSAVASALVERGVDGSLRPNLKAFNALQLLQAGVSAVDVSNLCTACNPELFYSHRQSGGTTGRQGAIACLIL
jgi:hypothetical protein